MSSALKVPNDLYMEEPSAETVKKGGRFKPLKLRTVLADNNISQAEWGRAIKQSDSSKTLSAAAVTCILRWDRWLQKTPDEYIKEQTATFLKDKGVSEEVIATVWDEEQDNRKRAGVFTSNKKAPQGLVGLEAGLIDALSSTTEVVMLTQDAMRHFNLSKNPFKNDMNGIDDVFMSVNHREILLAMHQAAKFAGLIAVVGESGAGKSVMKAALDAKIAADDENIIVIEPAIVDKKKSSANSLIEAIIRTLDPYASIPVSSEGKARKAKQVLTNSYKVGNRHVLIQEEAHKHDGNIFPFYKQLWEQQAGFTKLLGIVLIGQPELKYHLSLQHSWGSREFINRCEVAELQPLDSCVEDYLAFKFARVGVDAKEIIAPDVGDCLREVMWYHHQNNRAQPISILHPLFVNNRIVQTMNLCAEIGLPQITAEAIRKVKL